MNRKLLIALVSLGLVSVASGQQLKDGLDSRTIQELQNRFAESRTIFGGGNDLLVAGSQALLAGRYDEGIQLTELGLERPMLRDDLRASALSNLCAAYAGKQMPNEAIPYCEQSLAINERNWRAWSNRSYAFWLKGDYARASADLEAATAINPDARQLFVIRGMLNEAGLRPRVEMEDHQ